MHTARRRAVAPGFSRTSMVPGIRNARCLQPVKQRAELRSIPGTADSDAAWTRGPLVLTWSSNSATHWGCVSKYLIMLFKVMDLSS